MDSTRKPFGPQIAIAVIVVLVIVGALYFWNAQVTSAPASGTASQASVAPVSASDDVNSIQSDLTATDTGPDVSGLQ